jgi:3-phenylpropionate/cinnamic acid dioxygenase small subunit
MSAVLEAKDAIRELMATYAMALDACRFADVAACFAADGEWTTDYGAARGPAEIEAFIKSIVPVKGEGPQRKHYITNSIINIGSDGDRASALSDYLVVRESDNGLMPVMGGTYKDQFEKTPAGWRFARKELEHHIKGDMALKNGR